MAKQTISREELDVLLTTFENSLKKVSRKKYKGDPFGDDEISIGELMDVAKDLILSLRSLTRSRHTFSMLVERDERQAIASKIETLIKNTKDDRIDLLFNNLSELIRMLRGMNLRSGWSLVAGAKESAYELEQKAAALESREESLQLTLNALEKKAAEVEKIKEQISNYSKSIGQFAAKIDNREIELEKQAETSRNFEERLEEFESQQDIHLEKAKDLIRQAETALEVRTAEGLSKDFKTKAQKAGSKASLLWVLLAAAFIAGALYIGYKIIESSSLDISHVIARLSLIPVLLTGAWFAANRYIFQKNLAEDYDYKQVLMSSHVAFSRQLKEDKGSDEYYQDYIKGFLREIYQHPVKSNGIERNELNESKDKKPVENDPTSDRLLSRIKELERELDQKTVLMRKVESQIYELNSKLTSVSEP